MMADEEVQKRAIENGLMDEGGHLTRRGVDYCNQSVLSPETPEICEFEEGYEVPKEEPTPIRLMGEKGLCSEFDTSRGECFILEAPYMKTPDSTMRARP